MHHTEDQGGHSGDGFERMNCCGCFRRPKKKGACLYLLSPRYLIANFPSNISSNSFKVCEAMHKPEDCFVLQRTKARLLSRTVSSLNGHPGPARLRTSLLAKRACPLTLAIRLCQRGEAFKVSHTDAVKYHMQTLQQCLLSKVCTILSLTSEQALDTLPKWLSAIACIRLSHPQWCHEGQA